MRVLKSLIVGIGLFVFGVAQVYGLGLGDIELNSNLNQPLKAKIELFVVDPDELKQLEVKLADKTAYETSGVEHVHLLNDLIFTVVAVDGDKVVIEVTTEAPVREPFLDFIVEANWAAGRLLREYTLLLDPPIYAQEHTAPIVAAQTIQLSSVKSETASAAASEPESATNSSTATQSSDQFTGNEYGPVKNNENLWSIAERIRTEGSTTEQAMMGLFKANPDAFADNNINNLQAGYVLRVPDASVTQELSHSKAAKQARQHYNDWLTQRRLAAVASNQLPGNGAGLAARAETSDAQLSSVGSDAQLRLVSPEEGQDGLSGTGSGGLSVTDLARVQAAEADIAAQALQTRIQELESKLSQKERLLTLQNDALYELQQQLGGQEDLVEATTEFTDADAANDPTTIRSPSEVAANVETAESTAETITTPEEGVTSVADVEPESSAVVTAQVDQQSVVAENNWMDLLENTNALLIGGAVLLLIGALIWGWVRRRQLVAEEEFDAEAYGLLPGELQMPEGDGEIGIMQAETERPESVLSDSRIAPEEVESSDIFAEDSTAGIDSFETDDAEVDPLAEADVYLAYRRYGQAENRIRSALEQDPESERLQMKLMEIYYSSENQLAFEAEAEAIFARQGGDEAVWSQIVEMGRELCPDHPLFGETKAIDTAELDSLSLDEDIDLDSFDLDHSGADAQSQDDLFAITSDDVSTEMPAGADDHSAPLDSLIDSEVEDLNGIEDLVVDAGSLDDHVEPLASLDEVSITDETLAETDNEIASLLEGLDSFGEEVPDSPESKNIADSRVTDELPAGADQSQDHFEDIPSFDKEGAQAESQVNSEAELSTDNVVDFDSSEFAHSGRVVHGGGRDLPSDLDSKAADAGLDKKNINEGLSSDIAAQAEDTNVDFVAGLDLSGLGGDITSDDFSSESKYLQNDNEDSSAAADIIPMPGTEVVDSVSASVGQTDVRSGDLFGGMDAIGTKLDLARAYIEMEDRVGARDILEEVLEEGSDDQKQEAETIMHSMN